MQMYKVFLLSLSLVEAAVCLQGICEESDAPSSLLDSEPELQAVSREANLPSKRDRSIEHGTEWLLSAMRPNGMIGADVGQPPDLSCMSMVGLALVSQGNTPRCGPHCRELSQILDAVLARADWTYEVRRLQEPTLVQRKIGLNADLFLATLFLSQVLGESGDADDEVREAMEKLIEIICSQQGKDGTWGDESWAPVLGTVLGWESLRASHSCGFTIDASATLAGEALQTKLQGTLKGDGGWMHDFYKNASSIRVLHSLGYRNDDVFRKCADRTIKFSQEDERPFLEAGGEEYLAFFLVTECFLQHQDTYWKEWFPVVSEKIIQMQNADGSWSGHHCITDRTFCTTAALLTLQSPNFCLPISDL